MDVRAITESETLRPNSSFSSKKNSLTQRRSNSFKQSPRVKNVSMLRNSSSRKRRNNDVILPRNNISQAKCNVQKNSFLRRSVSVKSESPAAFRRTHSVRCTPQNQDSKGFTRRRTTTIGACEGNEIISTVRLSILLNKFFGGYKSYLLLIRFS